MIAAAREGRGLSREQAATASNIPGYYLTMIENDDYSSIADQLYLLPFLRRYAVFVGMDAEEVASRFIRDVQRADMNATRSTDPIPMIDHGNRSASGYLVLVAVVIVALILLFLGYRYFSGGGFGIKIPRATATEVAPEAPTPMPTVMPPPIVAAPPAADVAPTDIAPTDAPLAATVAPTALAPTHGKHRVSGKSRSPSSRSQIPSPTRSNAQ